MSKVDRMLDNKGPVYMGSYTSPEEALAKDVKNLPRPIKIDLGSGGPAADYLGVGWLGVDPYVDNSDIHAPMDKLPFEDGTVAEIFTSHALEHLGKFEVPSALKEMYRVLEKGGKVTIRVPDLEWCVRHWLNNKASRGWELDIIFGNQNHDGEFHKTGFTKDTLRDLVGAAKFKVTKIETINTHGQATLSLEATK
jgi:predicted SAM-dependent methyltransferase